MGNRSVICRSLAVLERIENPHACFIEISNVVSDQYQLITARRSGQEAVDHWQDDTFRVHFGLESGPFLRHPNIYGKHTAGHDIEHLFVPV